MSEKDWSSSYRPFKRWSVCPTRRDPGEVLLFSLEKCGIGPEEYVAYLLQGMSKRAIVASALGILAGEPVADIHFLPQSLADETFLGYHQQPAAVFDEYHTHYAQKTVEEAIVWLRRLPTLIPLANTTAQRVQILVLQCRYHELTLGIARDQRQTDVITFYAERAGISPFCHIEA